MRLVLLSHGAVLDQDTGAFTPITSLERVLLTKPGGVIVGRNLYPHLAQVVPMIRGDHGWTAQMKLQESKRPTDGRVGGVIYFTHMSYRFPKERYEGKRYRPGSIKWTVLNMELFAEVTDEDMAEAALSLLDLAAKRGIKPRYSPGSFGGSMLRASPLWNIQRNPAPWFISEKARRYLPGNYYALRMGYRMKTISSAYYLDQKSSHHTIASQISLPHPSKLRARGLLRAVENRKTPPWLTHVRELDGHVGLISAIVECDTLPPSQEHLYPPWAKERSKHKHVWIWTPELRLLDHRVRLRWISASLTSIKDDDVLSEYANWCLNVLKEKKHSAVKPAMLAAYGLLAVRTKDNFQRHSVHGRPQPPRSTVCELPLVGKCYRSTVEKIRVPAIQNVVARGVIEAETRTRSIEFARLLESEGTHVTQIYADGLLAAVDRLPFLPPDWRVAGALTNVHHTSPNTIISDEIVRMPGIPHGRRTVRIEQTSRVLA